MLNSDFCFRQSQVLTHGIANKDLGLTRMVRIEIYLPPLPLQQEFARQVTALENLKTAYRVSLTHLNNLFASLQHRAFRGEL
jgi:type I restriction enzyme S subunit